VTGGLATDAQSAKLTRWTPRDLPPKAEQPHNHGGNWPGSRMRHDVRTAAKGNLLQSYSC
jgi:hypothetical protein